MEENYKNIERIRTFKSEHSTPVYTLYIPKGECDAVLPPTKVPHWVAEGMKEKFGGNVSRMIRDYCILQLNKAGVYKPTEHKDPFTGNIEDMEL